MVSDSGLYQSDTYIREQYDTIGRGQGRYRVRGRGTDRSRSRDKTKDSDSNKQRSDSGSSLMELCDLKDLGMISVNVCPTAIGLCNGSKILAIRDTGCSCVIVKNGLVHNDQFLRKKKLGDVDTLVAVSID